MKRGTEQRTVRSFCRRKPTIDTRPQYQRGDVWSTAQKQLLIDSILHDLDIPKIYLREVNHGQFNEEIIDGQQRLLAIWGFYENAYSLSEDCDPAKSKNVAGLKFQQLDEDIKDVFEAYELSVIVLREASDEDVEEMFLRLQNGTPLNAAEKRNAMPGEMKLFVRSISAHPFFEVCGFSNHRFAYDHVAAQMILSELNGGICNLKNTDLQKMYKTYQTFDSDSAKAKKVRRVLDFLVTAFPQKTPELKKFNAISMYLLASQLIETFVVRGRETQIGQWFIEFETWRQEDEQKPIDQREPEMVSYLERTSHSTDSQDSLEFRHKVLLEHLHGAVPNLVPLDNQRRIFTEEQRLAIYRRDNGTCQVKLRCTGEKCEWNNWHADHRIPWSAGGKTIVENGQVACPDCNLAKRASIPVLES
jgi:hypothetical protein